MSVEQRIYDFSLDAKEDMEDSQFRVVAGSGEFGCVIAGAADEDSVGILQNKPEADAEYGTAEIRRVGISKAVCGDNIDVWDKVTPDVNGDIVTALEGERYVGVALQAGTDDRVISIMMEFGYAPAAS